MMDTATRCRHAIDIDDCACTAHARSEATVGVWVGRESSPACMDDRRTNNKNGGGAGGVCNYDMSNT